MSESRTLSSDLGEKDQLAILDTLDFAREALRENARGLIRSHMVRGMNTWDDPERGEECREMLRYSLRLGRLQRQLETGKVALTRVEAFPGAAMA
jgi:hypothetical protein